MSRTNITLLSILFASSLLGVYYILTDRTDKPIKNVILIAIDTVRYDTFFAADEHGFNDALSPWLKKARIYQNTQSVAPWTIPTVSTVLTGYYPNQHGAGSFPTPVANLNVQTPSAIRANVTSLADRLAEAGFINTAASSHPWFNLNFGMQKGFDKVRQMKSRKIDPWMAKHLSSWKTTTPVSAFKHAEKSGQQTLHQDRHFTYLHYMDAHEEHTRKGAEFIEAYGKLKPGDIQRWLSWTDLDECHKNTEGAPLKKVCKKYMLYTHANLELRQSIAKTLNLLETNKLLEDTLVIVYSDHGEEFYDHRQQALADHNDPRGIAGFGHGNSMYQELLHVPLLVWNPKDKSGRKIKTPVSLVDITPSILSWLGVASDKAHFPGMPLDQAEKNSARALFASNIAYGPEQVAVLDGKNKSIWNTVTDSYRYYDLKTDPYEKAPISNDTLVLQFDQLNGDYMDLANEQVGNTPELNNEQLEHLKAIGYLQGDDSSQSEPDSNSSTQPPEQNNTPEEDQNL